MNVAIPVFKNGVSPRLDVSDGLVVYDIDVDNGIVSDKRVFSLVFDYPAELISFMQKNGIQAIISGGCPQFFLRALVFHGFEVILGSGGDPDHMVRTFIEGKLE